jgi:hypothetical protein
MHSSTGTGRRFRKSEADSQPGGSAIAQRCRYRFVCFYCMRPSAFREEEADRYVSCSFSLCPSLCSSLSPSLCPSHPGGGSIFKRPTPAQMLKGVVAGKGSGNGCGPAAGAEEESERARLTDRAAQPPATRKKEKQEADRCGIALPPTLPPSIHPSLDSRSRSSRSAEQTNPTRTIQVVRSESAKGPASQASAAGSSKTQTKPLLQALASTSFYKFMALPEVLQVGKLVPIAEEEDADEEEEHAHAHADVAFDQEKHALADAALVDAADAVLVAQGLCCSKHKGI